jgi:Ser/Thr protein kinase RdoA (MazF antagonist)
MTHPAPSAAGHLGTAPPERVLELLGARPARISTLKDEPELNASWLLTLSAGAPVVLRRYHPRQTVPDLAYEHAVLDYLQARGWRVPAALSQTVEHDGLLYCLNQYVPGTAVAREDAAQRRRRGRDLARLHVALRDLGDQLGQRPGWQPQHAGVSVLTSLDWGAALSGLLPVSPQLAAWAHDAAERVRLALAAAGAASLPVTVLHGDFAEWNVHYARGRLAGIIDFGLTHLDSRPYELAIARTYRAPEMSEAYRAETRRLGWPLSELEEAAMQPVYHAFRVGAVAWLLEAGLRSGGYDLELIERQLRRAGQPPP